MSNCNCCDTPVCRKPRPVPVNEYDYVVVGVGTAGAPLVKLLTDDLVTSVFAIEGGERRNDDPIVLAPHFPGGLIDQLPEYHYARPHKQANISPPVLFPPLTFFGGENLYVDGRMWGGSQGHNYQAIARGTPDIYNQWAVKSGNPQWAYPNILPVMKFIETFTPNGTPPNPAQRGFAGPLFVTQTPQVATHPFVQAAISPLGGNTPYSTDFNDPTLGDAVVGSSQNSINPNTGLRSWAATAFLPPSVVDANGNGVGGRKLTIASLAVATKILFKGTRAVGVRYMTDGDPQRFVDVFARKKVILAAGTYVDALLLQRSGIGPAAVLDFIGVTPVFINENVGLNIQNAYGPTAIIPDRTDTPYPSASNPNIWTDLSGPNLGPATGVREAQLITFALPNTGTVFFIAYDMRTNRLGTASARSSNQDVDPLLTGGYYQDVGPDSDLEHAVRALKVIANISLQYTGLMPIQPPAALYPAPHPGGAAPDDGALRQYAIENSTYAYHATGSCRMATSAATGVVDGNLDVIGVTGLAVADNAVAPDIITGGTAWQALVIGVQKARIEGANVPLPP